MVRIQNLNFLPQNAGQNIKEMRWMNFFTAGQVFSEWNMYAFLPTNLIEATHNITSTFFASKTFS